MVMRLFLFNDVFLFYDDDDVFDFKALFHPHSHHFQ